MQEKRVRSPGQENPPDREMATHSNILAREIPWTEESGELESMRSQKESDMTEWLNHHHQRRRQRERHKKCKEDMLLRHRNDAFTLPLSGVEEQGAALWWRLSNRVFASKVPDNTEIKVTCRNKSYLERGLRVSCQTKGRTIDLHTGNIAWESEQEWFLVNFSRQVCDHGRFHRLSAEIYQRPGPDCEITVRPVQEFSWMYLISILTTSLWRGRVHTVYPLYFITCNSCVCHLNVIKYSSG